MSTNALFYLSVDLRTPLAIKVFQTNPSGTFAATAICQTPPSLAAAPQTCTGTESTGSGNPTFQTIATVEFDSTGKVMKAGLIYQTITVTGGACPDPLTQIALGYCPDPLPSTTSTVTKTIVDINSPLKPWQPARPFPYGNIAATTDPISTATGGTYAGPFTDLALGGPLPLVFRRTYDSALAAVFNLTAAGTNWIANFDPYLSVAGNLAVVALEGGGSVSFQQNGGVYTTLYPPRLAFQLVKTPTSYRFLHPQTNLIYDFDTTGRLNKIEDRNGNAITISLGPLGPQQATDGLGRSLTFNYSASGALMVLTSVQDQTGRTVSFTHDSSSNLTGVADASGNTITYTYSGSTYVGSLMKAANLPRGNTPYTLTFDPSTGAAISQTDSKGNVSKLSYVSGGKPGVTMLTDPLGRATIFNYTDPALQNLTSVVDAAGNLSSYAYDSLERPITFTDRLGNKTSITYDLTSGYPASFTDAQGNTTSFTYQAQVQGSFTFYNLAKIAYPDSTSETFTYDGSGNVLTATDRAAKMTAYTYNALGQVLTETNPAGGVTTLTYNADGTLAAVKDPSSTVTTFSYDKLKRLAKIQFADNTSRSFTRDALDQILSVIDERGKVTTLAYDANNNLQSVTDALARMASVSYGTDDLPSSSTDWMGNKTSYQYDPVGSPTAITDAAGEKTTYTYDNLERVQFAADSAGHGPSFGYDAEGRLTSVTDALGNKTTAQVDRDGRTTKVSSPLGETTNVSYDALGRVTGVTDALGGQNSFTYEPRGFLSSNTSPGEITTKLAYGSLPVLTSVTDPNGNVWTLATDTQGRVTSSTDPLGHSVKYTYDSRGRISSITSPVDSGQFSRDADGNLTQAQYSDGVTLAYAYDGDNRLISGTGFTFALDANGRLTESNGLAITRDAVGRIVSITYAPGKTATYAYDPRGLLANVTDWTGASVSFTFDDAHRLTSVTRSNGVVTAYTYDNDSRVASIADTAGTTTISSIVLTRDAIGRVTSAARNLQQEAALSSAASSSNNFDAANEIAEANYDPRGRLTDDNAGATYKWSAASRLLSYTRPDGSASAAYDGLGQRISRTSSDGASRNYVINYATELPSIATIQSGGSDLRYYVFTPEGQLLYSIDAATGAHRFYSFDETGSTTFLSGDSGAITDTYGISPYGDVVTAVSSNATDNPFTWQGQFGVMQEPGTTLYYARFRYYDASSQRFLSRDPLFSSAPREVNPYQYAAGNPMVNRDPRGLKTATVALDLNTSRDAAQSQPVILQSIDGSLGVSYLGGSPPHEFPTPSLVAHFPGPPVLWEKTTATATDLVWPGLATIFLNSGGFGK